MLPEDPQFSWLKLLAYAAFAAFGGFMGHILRTIDARQKIKWSTASIQGLAAGFVGVLVLLMCQAMNLSEQWTGVIVGVCGWLGANASIQFLETIVFNKLGITKKPTEIILERQDDTNPPDASN